jgi:hypothetical protein
MTIFGGVFWGIFLAIIIFFFCMVVFGRGKLKEFAVYQPDGEVLHVWRKAQNFWFDWPGQMVYQKENGKKVIIGSHWYLRIEELGAGEWDKIAEELKKKQEQE